MLLATAVGTLGGLTFLLATMLVLAERKLHVEEDPRVDAVFNMLPLTNCGACGYPGCKPLAQALVAGEAQPGRCTVSSESGRRQIAHYLGVDVGEVIKRVARLACAGGSNVAQHRARYRGHESCAAAAQVAGGGKGCFWGCLGLADCEVSCDFDAIHMDAHDLPVVDEELCTACGDCVDACPKDLFSLQEAGRRLWVACRSLQAGDELLDDCRVGCTACGRCAMDAPNAVEMQGNLPVVLNSPPESRAAIERCPTGAIVWLDADLGAIRGPKAPHIVRQGSRPMAAT